MPCTRRAHAVHTPCTRPSAPVRSLSLGHPLRDTGTSRRCSRAASCRASSRACRWRASSRPRSRSRCSERQPRDAAEVRPRCSRDATEMQHTQRTDLSGALCTERALGSAGPLGVWLGGLRGAAHAAEQHGRARAVGEERLQGGECKGRESAIRRGTTGRGLRCATDVCRESFIR